MQVLDQSAHHTDPNAHLTGPARWDAGLEWDPIDPEGVGPGDECQGGDEEADGKICG